MTVPAEALREIRTRQDRLKELLNRAGVRAPWDLDRAGDLYAARAIRLGGA